MRVAGLFCQKTLTKTLLSKKAPYLIGDLKEPKSVASTHFAQKLLKSELCKKDSSKVPQRYLRVFTFSVFLCDISDPSRHSAVDSNRGFRRQRWLVFFACIRFQW
jgi:hypothetical protein